MYHDGRFGIHWLMRESNETKQMRAAVLAVGDELVLGETLDTNSAWLAEQLASGGAIVREHATVRDDRDEIARRIRAFSERVDAVIVTGGLGPTADDLTRFAVADVTDPGESLVEDAEAIASLHAWFEGRGRSMPEGNRVQAMRPLSASVIENPHGTAPGLRVEVGGCYIFCLPGPPREMKAMFCNYVRGHVASEQSQHVLLVHSYGIGESSAAARLGDMMDRTRIPIVGTTASQSIVTARIRATGDHAAQSAVERDAAEVERRWSPWAFGRGETSLAGAVGKLLIERDEMLAVAESCTGGLLGSMIVEESGSSAYFAGGWLTYGNAMKTAQLGVDPELLDECGAVSEQVALAMASGARENAGVDHALAITGIAGPDGGSDAKPVGTVFIARSSAAADGEPMEVRRFAFTGDRTTVRDRSANSALQMLRFALIGDISMPLLWEVSLDGSPLPGERQAVFGQVDSPRIEVAT